MFVKIIFYTLQTVCDWRINQFLWHLTLPLFWRSLEEGGAGILVRQWSGGGGKKSLKTTALSPLIWSILQCCWNKLMITYSGAWKTVLILFHCLNANKTLFLVPTDVSLWDINPATEQTPLKSSGFVSDHWVLHMSKVLAGYLLLTCMLHPQLRQPGHYVWNQSYIWLRNREGLFLWLMEHCVIGYGACFCNLFLSELIYRNSSL